MAANQSQWPQVRHTENEEHVKHSNFATWKYEVGRFCMSKSHLHFMNFCGQAGVGQI